MSLDELFRHCRDSGSPDAQAIVRKWDALTDCKPEFTIETAEDALDESEPDWSW